MRLLTFAILLSFSVQAAEPFDIRDKDEFARIVPPVAMIEKLATGFKFTEGPVWFDDDAGGHLLFSDIPDSHIKKWTAKDGVTVFRPQSNQSNGNSRDLDGNLITCEHQSRQVTRTDKAGKIAVLATHYQNKRLNSPNDLVCKSDGSIFFTDPPYGLPRQSQGKELDKQHVFRLDNDGKLTSLIDDFDRPNGLALSPDEKKLYVADSGKPRHIRVFTVTPDNTLTDGKIFCTIDKGVPDGIRTDSAGRLYSSAGDGVHIFSPDGKLIGKILLPETCANLCFGGKDKNELYMTASKSLYRIKLSAAAK